MLKREDSISPGNELKLRAFKAHLKTRGFVQLIELYRDLAVQYDRVRREKELKVRSIDGRKKASAERFDSAGFHLLNDKLAVLKGYELTQEQHQGYVKFVSEIIKGSLGLTKLQTKIQSIKSAIPLLHKVPLNMRASFSRSISVPFNDVEKSFMRNDFTSMTTLKGIGGAFNGFLEDCRDKQEKVGLLALWSKTLLSIEGQLEKYASKSAKSEADAAFGRSSTSSRVPSFTPSFNPTPFASRVTSKRSKTLDALLEEPDNSSDEERSSNNSTSTKKKKESDSQGQAR